MKRLVVAALAALPLQSAAFAQDPGASPELLKEVRALRERVEKVEEENARLKGRLVERDLDSATEKEINALVAREGTTVKSTADPVTLIGEFRFRAALSLGDNSSLPGGGGSTPVGPGAPSSFSSVDSEHDGWWVDSLMRTGMLYDFGKDVTAYAEMRAKWAFGQASGTSFPYAFDPSGGFGGSGGTGQGSPGQPSQPSIFDVNTYVFVHQAWLEVRRVFGADELSYRVGRQEIALGNQFQIGGAEWYDGFNFDALRLDWTDDAWRLTGFAAKLQSVDSDGNQRTSFFNSHDDDELFALYFTYSGVQDHVFDAYWIYVNGHGGADDGGAAPSIGTLGNFVGDPLGSGGTAYYHTVGARASGLFPDVAGGLDYGFEAAWQFGSGAGSPSGTLGGGAPIGAYDVDAYAIEAEVGLTLETEAKLRVYARALMAEGPSSTDAAYTPLYPTRHAAAGFRARYGLFDLMPMSNVFSLQGGLHFDPAEEWTLGATVLWATADSSGTTPGNRRNGGGFVASVPDEDYGVEIDVWADYRAGSQLVISAGLAVLFPSDAGEALWLLDGDPHFYAYFQTRLAF
jgi:hypothetical protein